MRAATPPFTHSSIALLVTTSRFRLCRFFFCVFFSALLLCSCRWLISSFSWQRVAPDRMVIAVSLFTFPRLVMLSSVFFSRFIFCTKLPEWRTDENGYCCTPSYTRPIRFSTLFSRAAPSKLSSIDARSRQLINALGTRGGFVSSFLLYTHYTMAVIIFKLYSVCRREL